VTVRIVPLLLSISNAYLLLGDRPVLIDAGKPGEEERLLDGTVTLVEKWSGTVGFGAAAMKHRSVVHLSGNDGRGDFPPDREAVSHLGTPFGCGQSVPARPKMR